jgi:hypothetical protein
MAAALTQISPSSAIAGGPDFTLTLTATGFDTATVRVLWNGALLADSNVVSTDTITAVVPASHIAVAGIISVALSDTLNGASNALTFTVNHPAPTLSQASPQSIVAGDAFTLSLTGTSFLSNTAVQLAGTPLTVNAPTSTTLTALGAAGVFTRAGVYTLSVINPAPGGGVATTSITITPATLAVLRLSPAALSASINSTHVFTASGDDVYGNPIAALNVTWSLASPTAGTLIAPGAFTATFQAGTLAGNYPAQVRASANAITAIAAVTVTAGPLATLLLSPAASTLAVSTTQSFTASGFDAYNNVVPLVSVTWAVSPSIAGVIVSSAGTGAQFRAGTRADVYARAVLAASQGVTGAADITVTVGPLAKISLTPAAATLPVSTTQSFSAAGSDFYGNPVSPLSLSWSVNAGTPNAGSIVSSGPLTAVFRSGTLASVYAGAVQATAFAIVGSADVTVTPGALASLTLSPPALTAPVSTTQVFAASGADVYGNAISGLNVTWTLAASAGSVLSTGPVTINMRTGTQAGPYTRALQVNSLGISATADINVNAGPLARISLTPPQATLVVSTTQAVNASGADAYGNPVALVGTLWNVTPPAAGSIVSSGAFSATFRAGTQAGPYPAALQVSALSVSSTADITLTPGALAVITVTPGTATLVVSATRAFSATGADRFGNPIPSLAVTWSTLPPTAGNVQSSGVLTAVFRAGIVAGVYTDALQATAGVITGSADITVTPGALVSMTLSPAGATLPVNTLQTFTASGYDAHHNLIPTLSLSWSVSNTAGSVTAVGALSADIRTGTVPGPYPNAVRVSSGAINSSASLTLTAGPVARIALAPKLVSLPISTAQTFTATAYDVYSNVVPGQAMVWSVLPDAGNMVSSGALTVTFVSTTTPGTYFGAVQASIGAVSSASDVIVREGPVAQVVITPSLATLVVNATQLFTATVLDGAGNSRNDLPVTWLPPSGGAIRATGAFTMLFQAGTAAGPFVRSVQAAQGVVIGSADVNVTPGPLASMQVTPSLATVQVSTTQVFTALGYDVYHNALPNFSVVWGVTPSGVGNVQPSGITMTFRAGLVAGSYPAAVRATAGALTGSADIVVTPGALARIALAPPTLQLPVTFTQTVTANGFDVFNNPTSLLAVTWVVTPAMAGTVVSSGALSATFQASTTAGVYTGALQATSGAVSAALDVTVTYGPLASLTLTPGAQTLPISGTQTFTPTGADAYGNPVLPVTVTWSVNSMAGRIVISDARTALFRAGVVAGAHPNAILAQATQGGVSAHADVTITPDLPAQLTLRANPNPLRTDGVSSSTVAISVTDGFGNAVGAGFTVSASVACTFPCLINPSNGVTGPDGVFTSVITGALRAVTQTVNSTLRVTAQVSPALGAGGVVSNGLMVAGIFTPTRIYLPLLKAPLNNHTVCMALPVTPPDTVTQQADQFNLYRFVATTASYDMNLSNFPSPGAGSLYVYRIQTDNCATTGIMDLVTLVNPDITSANQAWLFSNIFTPGVSYMVMVYNRSGNSPQNYTLSISPHILPVRAARPSSSGIRVIDATALWPQQPFSVNARQPPSVLLRKRAQ